VSVYEKETLYNKIVCFYPVKKVKDTYKHFH